MFKWLDNCDIISDINKINGKKNIMESVQEGFELWYNKTIYKWQYVEKF